MILQYHLEPLMPFFFGLASSIKVGECPKGFPDLFRWLPYTKQRAFSVFQCGLQWSLKFNVNSRISRKYQEKNRLIAWYRFMVWLIEIQCHSYLSYLFFMILSLSDSKCCFQNSSKQTQKLFFIVFLLKTCCSTNSRINPSTKATLSSSNKERSSPNHSIKTVHQRPNQDCISMQNQSRISMPKKSEYRCSKNTGSRWPIKTEYRYSRKTEHRYPKRLSINTQKRSSINTQKDWGSILQEDRVSMPKQDRGWMTMYVSIHVSIYLIAWILVVCFFLFCLLSICYLNSKISLFQNDNIRIQNIIQKWI